MGVCLLCSALLGGPVMALLLGMDETVWEINHVNVSLMSLHILLIFLLASTKQTLLFVWSWRSGGFLALCFNLTSKTVSLPCLFLPLLIYLLSDFTFSCPVIVCGLWKCTLGSDFWYLVRWTFIKVYIFLSCLIFAFTSDKAIVLVD